MKVLSQQDIQVIIGAGITNPSIIILFGGCKVLP